MSSSVTSARSGFLPACEGFSRGTGWMGASCLPNAAPGEVPFLSRSVSSPALKILLWNVPFSARSHRESLSWAGRKQSPGLFCVLQEGRNQLPRTIIKRTGTENCARKPSLCSLPPPSDSTSGVSSKQHPYPTSVCCIFITN